MVSNGFERMQMKAAVNYFIGNNWGLKRITKAHGKNIRYLGHYSDRAPIQSAS
jgi:hypothetical protein